ncbi:DUF5659 domain-containing protein [Clostridium pasteurianum]|uniref:DUF5659 domain-containing protein n=1 Tax=Clostridium pasteurianum TaxID=1501 RepID=UPI002260A6AC|nr:DUF5659 domain-containing protein [Clostridium pasteurianum]UZW12591.1 DUF5659 domain-containing protein [Clostridium pasteurianum]
MVKENNLYVVRGYRLANYLMDNGINMVRVDRNKKNKSWLIFLFEDTYKLRKAITKFNYALKNCS